MNLRTIWAIGCSVALLFGFAPDAEACRKPSAPTLRPADVTYFLGTATADVVRAGPGNVTFYPARGPGRDPLEAPDGPVYGQVVRLDRVGGRDASRVRELAERFDGVVLVPWGYRADCLRTVWRSDMPWAEPGARGKFRGMLRDPEHWVGERPTFDVEGLHEPYPHGWITDLREVHPDSTLTPDELFSLYTILPDRYALEVHPEAALRPVQSWVADNPELEARAPVPQVVRSLEMAARRMRASQTVLPMFGTYRVSIRAENGPPRTLYVRTSSRPSSAPGAIDGYWLRVYVARQLEDIPDGPPTEFGLTCDVGSVTMAEEGVAYASSGKTWSARLDLMLELCFADDPEVMAAVEEAEAIGGDDPFPGRFVLKPDGSARFEQVVQVDGRAVLRVEAERISDEVVRQRI